MITITEQIEEVRREVAAREKVYPAIIGAGGMSAGDADRHLSRIRAVLATLEKVARRECRNG